MTKGGRAWPTGRRRARSSCLSVGSFVEAGVVDELFLTVSPLLAGRGAGSEQLGLVEGVDLLPEKGARARLLSAKRQHEHLFLRYAMIPPRTVNRA